MIGAPPRRVLLRRRLRVALLLTACAPAAPACGSNTDACRMDWERADVLELNEHFGGARRLSADAQERRFQEFAWTVMALSADLHATGSRGAADALRELLRVHAANDAFVHTPVAGSIRTNVESVARLRTLLLPLLTAWEELRRTAPPPDDEARAVEAWLARMVQNADVDTGPLATRGRPRDCRSAPDWFDSNCNHQQLKRHAVNLAWGLPRRDEARVRRAVAGYRDALSRLRSDGGMPGELGRGSLAIWYTREAIATLVFMAETASRLGHDEDLYAADVDGRSLHLAIRYFLEALDDPRRVWPDAKTNFDPGLRKYYRRQVLRFLRTRPSGRHLMAWIEPYIARFPEHENAQRLARLEDGRLLDGDRPLVDDGVGGNATCLYARAAR